MKNFFFDILTILRIALIGFFVSLFAYPLIHESGHIIATLITGGKIAYLAWLPVPRVMCEVDITGTAASVLISLAGIIFPMIFVLPLLLSKGSIRFGAMIFSFICSISCSIGLFVVVLRAFGIILLNEDITTLIEYTDRILPSFFVMLALSVAAIGLVILFNPRKTFMLMLELSPSRKNYLLSQKKYV